jgi:hypothetical protein
MKKRAFDDEEEEDARAAPPESARTEPAPRAGLAMGLVLTGWLLPLTMVVSVFRGVEDDPTVVLVHRAITLVSIALALVSLGLAIRALDAARRDPRVRRRLAGAALALGLLSPIVWGAELVLAMRVYLVRERLAAEQAAAAAPVSEDPETTADRVEAAHDAE